MKTLNYRREANHRLADISIALQRVSSRRSPTFGDLCSILIRIYDIRPSNLPMDVTPFADDLCITTAHPNIDPLPAIQRACLRSRKQVESDRSDGAGSGQVDFQFGLPFSVKDGQVVWVTQRARVVVDVIKVGKKKTRIRTPRKREYDVWNGALRSK